MIARIFAGIGVALAPAIVSAQSSLSEVERCRVIAQEMVDYNDQSRIVFERFCETLFLAAPAPTAHEPATAPTELPTATLPGGRSEYFVKCVVSDDPDYIGFRLVTRSQCDDMRGQVAQAPRETAPQTLRDFSPKAEAE